MHMDVEELTRFYGDPLGRMARRFVRRRVRALWPDVHGLDVLGLGYATPYLRPLKEQAQRVIAMMPAAQGGEPWPCGERNLTALVDETGLPLADCAMDRVLLVHELENTETVRAMLREIWRVLTPEGRLLAVVPSRRGMWSGIERTPFGHGRPFSERQLRRLLSDCLFTPVNVDKALFMPPFAFRFLITSAGAWERTGRQFWPHFPGVLLMEASKDVMGLALPERSLRVRPLLRPVPKLARDRAAREANRKG
ncbi:MAG: class I SAM-dependent methyltransferase [Alphaproteobacteria bacterium]